MSSSGLEWDDNLPVDIIDAWKKWLGRLHLLHGFSLPRSCYVVESTGVVSYQLHGFCDASNLAYSCVIYLRRLDDDKPEVNFILGKPRLVLTHQSNWVISRKELEAAKLCSELMLQASGASAHLNVTRDFWTDSQVVLKWITNPDLHLARFVKRRVNIILRVAPLNVWKYVPTSQNPADVGTRETTSRTLESVNVWLRGPSFLLLDLVDAAPSVSFPVVQMTLLSRNAVVNVDDSSLDNLIAASSNLYVLRKRLAYLMAFAEFVMAKAKGTPFLKPDLNAAYLDRALLKVVKYVQGCCFGAAIKTLRQGSPDDFEAILRRFGKKPGNTESTRRINELKTLRNLRPCVDSDSMFRVECRLENAELPIDTGHPLIFPGRHALTRLIVLCEHSDSGHAGPSYTFMKTRQRLWIIHGISSVKHYITDCGKCALNKAKPITNLMSNLPACRLMACNKPFKICGVDYLGL